jgi:putative transposase
MFLPVLKLQGVSLRAKIIRRMMHLSVFSKDRPPDTDALWDEVNGIVQPQDGFLIIDDTTLDKPHVKNMDLVYRQWSGKHHRVVNGINSCTLLWTDGNAIIPVDFRIYDIDADGKTKNDPFRDMLRKAKERSFQPRIILFDS